MTPDKRILPFLQSVLENEDGPWVDPKENGGPERIRSADFQSA
jgi:hypothetical protein